MEKRFKLYWSGLEGGGYVQQDKYVGKAKKAWFKKGKTEIPSEKTDIQYMNDQYYVVLSSGNGILGVYLLSETKSLKYQKKIPLGIE